MVEDEKLEHYNFSYCLDCKSKLYGKKECINNTMYYGLFCKKCKAWVLKDTEFLDRRLAYADSEIYKIFILPNNVIESDQLKTLSKSLNIELSQLEQYFNCNDKVCIVEGDAESVLNIPSKLESYDISYEIEPEYPYPMLRRKISAEELSRAFYSTDKIYDEELEHYDFAYCSYCRGKLYGRKECINNTMYYGLFCKRCKEWGLQYTEFLNRFFADLDNEIYKIFILPNNVIESDQLKTLSESFDIEFSQLEQYFNCNDKVCIVEGNAESVLNATTELAIHNISFYEIEPEFPYEILRPR